MANIDVSLLGRVYYWLCWWNIWYWVVCQNNSIINMLIRLILMLNKFIWNMHFCPLCWRIFFTVYLFRLEGVHIQRILVPIQELLKIAHSCFLSRGLPFWTLHCLKNIRSCVTVRMVTNGLRFEVNKTITIYSLGFKIFRLWDVNFGRTEKNVNCRSN